MSAAAIERDVTMEANSPSAAVAVVESESGSIAAFASQQSFIAAQRIARALSASTLVPEAYRGDKGLPNCLVAMELASRTGASVLMVMQNLHVIQGRPSWSAAFLIASVNTCGRFSPLRYEWQGAAGSSDWACRAVALEKETGDRLEGEWITMDMVKSEGWLGKPGSKWKTMAGQMFRYRAASFWCRTYAPEISLGMHSSDEVADMEPASGPSRGTRDLNAALRSDVNEVEVTATVEPAPVKDASTCDLCGGKDGIHFSARPMGDD